MAKVVEEKQENTIDDIKSVIGDIKKINNLTKENMYEYGFTICKSDDGTVFTTPIIEGEEERIQREELYVSCPRGSREIAHVHTHPSGYAGAGNKPQLSVGDIVTSLDEGTTAQECIVSHDQITCFRIDQENEDAKQWRDYCREKWDKGENPFGLEESHHVLDAFLNDSEDFISETGTISLK